MSRLSRHQSPDEIGRYLKAVNGLPLAESIRFWTFCRNAVVGLESEWVGKVISRIGKQAGIVVHPGDKKTGRKPKYASAHDLRRTCSQQMIDAGVPEMLLQRVMRHASFETTKRHYSQHNLQRECHVLKTFLGTVDTSE